MNLYICINEKFKFNLLAGHLKLIVYIRIREEFRFNLPSQYLD